LCRLPFSSYWENGRQPRNECIHVYQRMDLTRRLWHNVAAFALALSASVWAGSTLVPADSAMLADAARFRVVPAEPGIPSEVLDCCSDSEHRLARPGERWSPSDALPADNTLARRRLVWIARSPEFTVVHFEQGGIVHTFQVVVLRSKAWPVADAIVWRASGPRLADYAQFVGALAKGAFTAEP
jgi:hypothetical protein